MESLQTKLINLVKNFENFRKVDLMQVMMNMMVLLEI